MASDTFTLILTKGTHVVSAASANIITTAIRAGQPVVEVELDLFGTGDLSRIATLATGHVVALTRNPAPRAVASQDPGQDGKITALKPRR